jgi:hypothetical protein
MNAINVNIAQVNAQPQDQDPMVVTNCVFILS